MRRLVSLLIGSLILVVPSVISAAEELPKRRPGLWEMKMNGPAGPQVIKQCVDAETDRLAVNAMAGPNACTQTRFEKVGDTYEVEATCKLGAMTSKGKSKISGDFAKKLRFEVVTEITGAPGSDKPVTSTTSQETTYVGPCAAGQSPGDVIMPDGKIMKAPGTIR